MISRRVALGLFAGAATTALGGIALGRRGSDPSVLRVGTMANLTHAPMLAGLGSGRFARALAPVRIESRVFRAGPRVTEALIGDAIDVGTAGPAPVVIHHARHSQGGRGGLRILGGCSSGGASLVVSKCSGIASAADLHGRRIAVTQLGTTQDVALRAYLAEHGLRESIAGGDVRILAIAGSTILAQMQAGDLDGAWLPEPWATRIVRDLDARRLVDERDLWEGRRFATAVLASRADRARSPSVARLVEALRDEVDRAVRDPATTRDEAYAELRRTIGDPGKRVVFDEAWRFIDFTSDPVRSSIDVFGARARALGLVPPDASTAGLVGEPAGSEP